MNRVAGVIATALRDAILAALRAGGYAVVKLSESEPGWWDTYEDDGEEPDHLIFGDESGEFVVTVWHDHPHDVQVSHQGEPLEPITRTEAHSLAAKLLAAVDATDPA